jgi:hypothetical protein
MNIIKYVYGLYLWEWIYIEFDNWKNKNLWIILYKEYNIDLNNGINGDTNYK